MLGPAGHVEAADQGHGLEAGVAGEDLQQRLQGAAERRHLLGKAEDQPPPLDVALRLHPGEQTVVQALDQGVERLPYTLSFPARGVGAKREGVAPDLLPAGGVQVVEELGEPSQ